MPPQRRTKGLLQPAPLQVATRFQSHHKEHRDALVATIRKLGGVPVAEKAKADYVRDLNAASIRNQTDILRLAARLERGAANAYLGVIPSFGDRGLAQVSARPPSMPGSPTRRESSPASA